MFWVKICSFLCFLLSFKSLTHSLISLSLSHCLSNADNWTCGASAAWPPVPMAAAVVTNSFFRADLTTVVRLLTLGSRALNTSSQSMCSTCNADYNRLRRCRMPENNAIKWSNVKEIFASFARNRKPELSQPLSSKGSTLLFKPKRQVHCVLITIILPVRFTSWWACCATQPTDFQRSFRNFARLSAWQLVAQRQRHMTLVDGVTPFVSEGESHGAVPTITTRQIRTHSQRRTSFHGRGWIHFPQHSDWQHCFAFWRSCKQFLWKGRPSLRCARWVILRCAKWMPSLRTSSGCTKGNEICRRLLCSLWFHCWSASNFQAGFKLSLCHSSHVMGKGCDMPLMWERVMHAHMETDEW